MSVVMELTKTMIGLYYNTMHGYVHLYANREWCLLCSVFSNCGTRLIAYMCVCMYCDQPLYAGNSEDCCMCVSHKIWGAKNLNFHRFVNPKWTVACTVQKAIFRMLSMHFTSMQSTHGLRWNAEWLRSRGVTSRPITVMLHIPFGMLHSARRTSAFYP